MGTRETTSEPFVWEEPPPRALMYDWSAIATALKTKPNEWMRVFENDRASVANAIRQGKIRAVAPEYGFEMRTSNNTREGVRTCSLHLRFNPDLAPREVE